MERERKSKKKPKRAFAARRRVKVKPFNAANFQNTAPWHSEALYSTFGLNTEQSEQCNSKCFVFLINVIITMELNFGWLENCCRLLAFIHFHIYAHKVSPALHAIIAVSPIVLENVWKSTVRILLNIPFLFRFKYFDKNSECIFSCLTLQLQRSLCGPLSWNDVWLAFFSSAHEQVDREEKFMIVLFPSKYKMQHNWEE